MSSEEPADLVAKELLRKSLFFRELQAELEEILRHKWLESEKAGYDIGFDVALIDWKVKHSTLWRQARQGRRLAVTFQI